MSILVKNIQKYRFLSKLSIVMKIVKKSHIWSILSKNLDFGQNCWKFSILVKIYQTADFGLKIR